MSPWFRSSNLLIIQNTLQIHALDLCRWKH